MDKPKTWEQAMAQLSATKAAAEKLADALKEIDYLLVGNIPITKEVKEIARAALKTYKAAK